MITRLSVVALLCVALGGAAGAQTEKPAAKPEKYDVTIKAEETTYTGTANLTIDRGKVTGDLRLVSPTEVTAKIAGTAKAGALDLDFPYLIVEQQCTGNVKMTIKVPAKPGPATGTMIAVGCGRDPAAPLNGTVEFAPADPDKKK
jgi:hypothetical protein